MKVVNLSNAELRFASLKHGETEQLNKLQHYRMQLLQWFWFDKPDNDLQCDEWGL